MADDAVSALTEKYEALLTLRVARDDHEAAGHVGFSGELGESRLAEMGRIAERFPGALKELETSNAERFRARLGMLADASDDGHVWIPLMADFHALLRELLAIKRRLADESNADATFADWHQAFAHRSGLVRVGDASVLSAVKVPPGGRLVTLAWQLLENKYGQPRAQLEALLR